jgi:hypothetical protein
VTRRKPNLRRLVNSWSARALWLIAGIASVSEILPSIRSDLPGWVPGIVAVCALILRVVTEGRK